MKTTRQSNYGRIFVAFLNPKLIPKSLDVVIGDHYFELNFEVDKMGFDENGNEVKMELGKGDGDDNGEEEQDDERRDGRGSKRAKNDDMAVDGKGNGALQENKYGTFNGSQEQMEVLENNISVMAEGLLDVVVGRTVVESYDKVRNEIEQPEVEGGVNTQLIAGEDLCGDGVVELGEIPKEIKEEWVDRAARISEVVVTPTHLSARLASSGEMHSVEKAKKRKAWKN
ncbi:hypothetical protein E2562_021773 [Oryza meyeriana var. granulata]|uniref:DUF4283 domain-containing protein n=1 Tax=Oryza meyeriana var. granulata TaxID=110450 RepID=A0A6G1EY29_9ORYZ|nr:hypothetical protein E2562_021773 [Oryza meyeriana var. granulata]